jgi:hypothetical protein
VKAVAEPSAAPSTPAAGGTGSKPTEKSSKEPSPKSTDVHNYGTDGTCIY